jgi:hypothetical protein
LDWWSIFRCSENEVLDDCSMMFHPGSPHLLMICTERIHTHTRFTSIIGIMFRFLHTHDLLFISVSIYSYTLILHKYYINIAYMYIDMCVGVKHIVPRGVAMPTTAPLPTLGRSLWWIRQDLSVHQLPSDLAQPDAGKIWEILDKVGPPCMKSLSYLSWLVNITPISLMVYGITHVYKPTNMTGGHHNR